MKGSSVSDVSARCIYVVKIVFNAGAKELRATTVERSSHVQDNTQKVEGLMMRRLAQASIRYVRRPANAILALVFLAAVGPSAFAQSPYPNRTIKIVVPVPPGPVADLVPRLIGEKLAERWSQSVIVENRPGAALNIGADAVARSEPDGYTLLATPPNPLVVSQHYYSKLPFDPAAFVPVSVLVAAPTVLVANPKVPASNLPELIAYAKANPDKLSYGSAGAGSTPHLIMVKLLTAGGIRLVHVPYQGLAPALRDVLAGHVDVMVDIIGNVAEHIKAGRLKLIAATTETRLADFPDAKTISETLPGISHTDWFAIVAPPLTPSAIAAQISTTIAETLKRPDITRRLKELYLVPVGSSPEETAAFLKRESDKWREVIAASGLKKVE